jgi:aspartyl-tRNA(Asn)/glutamyl-tRNA(Gln) amidotransferase subunit B
VKNVNSFRYLARAIEFEIERQTRILENGGTIVQETRLYDSRADETRSMRSKEEAHDYRYFPDPDLLTLDVENAWVEEIRGALPLLPHERSDRYQREWSLPVADAEGLVATRELAEYFERTADAAKNPKLAANWVRNEVLRIVNERSVALSEFRVTPEMLGGLIQLIESGAIGGKAAKDVFDAMADSGEAAQAIVERKGLAQISDPDFIRDAALRIVERHRAQVDEYRSGKTKIFGFLVGQLMKETRGKANAEMANATLRDVIERQS